MCVLIGQQVCFHGAMKRDNDLRNMAPNCKNLQFHERNKNVHTPFVYRLSLC